MSRARWSFALALLVASPALAQAPAGPEFRVSSGPPRDGNHPAVATDAAGNFVIAWSSVVGGTGSSLVRLFDPLGTPRGNDIVAGQHTGAAVRFTRTASEPGGAFVVVWEAVSNQTPGDVFARRFDAAGTPLGTPFRVNTSTSGSQSAPDVARAPDGSFVVVWADDDGGPPAAPRISARRFAADGSSIGAEFTVGTGATGARAYPAVATDGSGNFVVAWEGYRTIEGRRFSAAGTPLGAVFQANANTSGILYTPSVAAHPDGRFVVAWYSLASHIAARRYAADGTPLGGELAVRRLNSDTSWAADVSAAMLPSGGFVVAWSSLGSDAEGSGVEAKRFDPAGNPLSRAFLINSTESNFQFNPALAADPAGNVVAVWLSLVPIGVTEVFGQRFGRLGAASLAVDAAASATSDGNGVLERGETADMEPAWQNNTGAPLAMPATLAAFSGPAGATYTIDDGAGSYGTVPAGGTQPCIDCYRIGVAGVSRPALHWDGTATELIGDGTTGMKRWRMHVGDSFDDVARPRFSYRFVETLLHFRVTTGCASSLFCPLSAVTRDQLAVFLLAAKEDQPYTPMRCTFARFDDVPLTSPFCRWIDELARRGVVTGCGGGNYCPGEPVTREQMAIFMLRTLDPAVNPPACVAGSEVFADVPASSPFCRWIEEAWRRGIVHGCGGGNYCPTDAVTREQMAVFLTATFDLTLYGP